MLYSNFITLRYCSSPVSAASKICWIFRIWDEGEPAHSWLSWFGKRQMNRDNNYLSIVITALWSSLGAASEWKIQPLQIRSGYNKVYSSNGKLVKWETLVVKECMLYTETAWEKRIYKVKHSAESTKTCFEPAERPNSYSALNGKTLNFWSCKKPMWSCLSTPS